METLQGDKSEDEDEEDEDQEEREAVAAETEMIDEVIITPPALSPNSAKSLRPPSSVLAPPRFR